MTGNLKIYAAVIFIATVIISSNSLNNGFVFDDNTLIENNTLVQRIDNIPKLFVSNYWANTPYENAVLLYRPLVTASFALD